MKKFLIFLMIFQVNVIFCVHRPTAFIEFFDNMEDTKSDILKNLRQKAEDLFSKLNTKKTELIVEKNILKLKFYNFINSEISDKINVFIYCSQKHSKDASSVFDLCWKLVVEKFYDDYRKLKRKFEKYSK